MAEARPRRSRPPRKTLIQRALRNIQVTDLTRRGSPELAAVGELQGHGEELWRSLVRKPTSLLDLSWSVLCGHRVSQMTKAYNDVDAVTQLLEEKEKDLELAAKIGQQLLQRNKQVEERLTQIEGELQAANDTITQLRHELQLKTELLHIYNNDFDESGSEVGTPSGVRHLGVELLQTKTSALEKENSELRTELLSLKEQSETAEGREKDLVSNVVFELTDANETIRSLSDELAARVDEHMKNQEEVTGLLAQLVDSQSRAKRLSQENEELQSFMSASKEAQSELALELADLKDRYAELQAMYHDAQQHIRRSEKKSASNRSSYLGGITGQPDSLASELELSLSSMGSNDSGLSPAVGITPFPASQKCTPSMISVSAGYRSAFDTVRCAQRGGAPSASASIAAAAAAITYQTAAYPGTTPLPGVYPGTGVPGMLQGATTVYQTMGGVPTAYQGIPAVSGTYQGAVVPAGAAAMRSAIGSVSTTPALPGLAAGSRVSSRPWPGSGSAPDLSGAAGAGGAAVGAGGAAAGGGAGDSGAWMQDNVSQISESDCSIEMDDTSDVEYPGIPRGIPGIPGSPDLRAALHRLGPADLSSAKLGSDGMRTPESIMSLGSSRGSLHSGAGGAGWRMPEKLQIVKPMEGSLTLHHWSRLATPHMGSLLDSRPGVSSRCERPLHPSDADTDADAEWSSEAEEPDAAVSFKTPDYTGGVYTLTNSTVMHPDDVAVITSTLQGGQMSTLPVMSCASATPSSAHLTARRASASTYTFSTHLGLARALHERGVTPSLCGSGPPSGTSTPANSPVGSRGASPAPAEQTQPALIQGLMDVGKLGARLIRRTFASADDAPKAPSYSRNQEPQRPAAEGATGGGDAEGADSDTESTTSSRTVGSRLRHHMSVMERLQRIGLQGILAADGAPVPALSAAKQGGTISRAQLGVPAKPGTGALQGRLAMLGTVPKREAGRGRRNMGAIGRLSVHSAGRKGGFS